ncbi:MAG: MotA/TolQ/ExbB proton channel family protein [Pseudomonadota bacterium]|nr:MotA/TolQ/ExbB proton channel family protein [Pseudomonadota bacterium]
MDIATLIGLIVGFGLVLAAIMMGGPIGPFINVPSILIVIAGTFGIVTVCYKLPDIIKAQGLLFKTLLFKVPPVQDEARYMLELAQKARANGLLAIQADVDQMTDAFLKQGLTLAVDGTNPEVIEGIMHAELAQMEERHGKGVGIFKKSAEIAPAMGLVGTLIGLVQMLQNLSDPNAIGPAMAVALLTTLYGAIIANMFFNPLAAKLELNSGMETQLRHIYILSVMSMVKQENPRQLEMMINTVLPPASRISVFE